MIHASTRAARLLTLLALTLTLGACASTGSGPALFVLDNDQPPARTTAPSNAPTLMVAPVSVAPYLDQGGIVYQTAPYRVVIANDNRWAAPLPGALTDMLFANLSQHLSGIDLIRSTTRRHDLYQLQTRVDEFDGHFDGNAHIAGQWTLVDPDGRTLLTRTFDQRVPLSEDGYPALVASLSQGWREVSSQITPALQQTLAPGGR